MERQGDRNMSLIMMALAALIVILLIGCTWRMGAEEDHFFHSEAVLVYEERKASGHA